MPATISLGEFFSRAQLNSESGCHEWSGCLSTTGYGVQIYKRVRYKAHRLAWFFIHGRHPTGLLLHSCDNRRCINVAHLREGTVADNTRDMIERGRQPDWMRPKTHCKRGHELTPETTYNYKPSRICKLCAQAKNRAYKAKVRGRNETQAAD